MVLSADSTTLLRAFLSEGLQFSYQREMLLVKTHHCQVMMWLNLDLNSAQWSCFIKVYNKGLRTQPCREPVVTEMLVDVLLPPELRPVCECVDQRLGHYCVQYQTKIAKQHQCKSYSLGVPGSDKRPVDMASYEEQFGQLVKGTGFRERRLNLALSPQSPPQPVPFQNL